jgi:uncharacterized membrane protein HdeD (DUF308 family)
MSADQSSSPVPTVSSVAPVWIRGLLGIVLILAGLAVIADVTFATAVSALVIGVLAIVSGAFDVIHAFWTKGWGGFGWQILLGVLYLLLGIVLMSQPDVGALRLTYVLGLLFLLSGVVRIMLAIAHWQEIGWIMLLSGAFGVLAGLVILTGFPLTGLWVLGLLLGIDLISHGSAWLGCAFLPSARTVRTLERPSRVK